MNFIEGVFGISPDGGSGAFELVLAAVPVPGVPRGLSPMAACSSCLHLEPRRPGRSAAPATRARAAGAARLGVFLRLAAVAGLRVHPEVLAKLPG